MTDQPTRISLRAETSTDSKPSREAERFSGGSRLVITVCAVLALFACYKIWTRPNLTATDIRLQTASSASTPQSRLVTKPIGEARCFDWVLADNPYGANPDEDVDVIDWRQWRIISLRLAKDDGSIAEIKLARSLAWLELEQAEVGEKFRLDLPEMGIAGWSDVLDIRPAPELRERPSQQHSLITATFKHHVDGLIDLQIEGESNSLGVTGNHPFWSVDRQEFIPVGDLAINERVQTYNGDTKRVISKLARPGPAAVYNIEVFGEHVYHVGGDGLLVHNSCTTAFRSLNPNDVARLKQGLSVLAKGRRGGISAQVDLIASNAENTKFICATESIDVVRKYGDPQNYIKFNPQKMKAGTYISKNDLLSNKAFRRAIGSRYKYVTDQVHSLIVGEIPWNAIDEIIIDGVRIK